MSELQAIESLISDYFKGLHEGNLELIQKVFLPTAEIFGYYEGERVTIKLHEYLNILKRQSPPIMLDEDFDMRIDGIDQIGLIAHVRARYLFQALRYTEYLSLMKFDDHWKVVSKTFHHDEDDA